MDRLREKVRNLLEEGKVAEYPGYKMTEGHPLRYLFTTEHLEEVDETIVAPGAPRYPLDKLLQQIASRYPEDTIAIQVRGCDERGLNELYKWSQLDPEKVVLVGIACPQSQADYCECPGPWAPVIDYGEKCEPVLRSARVDRIDALAGEEAFQEWQDAFNRCIDCGLCEENCPADIPLRVLYKKGNMLVKELFAYDTGSPEAGLSPWKFLGDEPTMETKPM